MGVKVREWKGAWYLFVDHQGRRKAKRVGVGKPGKRAADLAAEKIQAKLALGDLSVFDAPATPAPAVPTFRAVYEEWLQKYPVLRGIAPGTLANYRSFADRHLVPFFGDMPITAITVDTVEDFIEAKLAPGGSVKRSGKALADSSLKVGLQPLRLVLQRAVRRRLIAANPMKEIERRRLIQPDNVDPFSGAELRAILDAASRLNPDFAVMLRVWAQSGMRAGEVAALQWQDIDVATGLVTVRRSWTRDRLGPTKTRQERSVSILHPIVDDSHEWCPGATEGARSVFQRLRGLTVQSLEPDAFVFPTSSGKPFSSKTVHSIWKRILLAARVRYRSPEQLRHTFASTMLSRNAPLLYVQQQGGWRSATVLLRVYARWMPQPSATQPQPTSVGVISISAPNAR